MTTKTIQECLEYVDRLIKSLSDEEFAKQGEYLGSIKSYLYQLEAKN